MALLQGYTSGLVAALLLSLGPVFFTLLKITLQHGTKSGLSVVGGIFMADFVVLVLLYVFGASDFFRNENYQFAIGLAGSAILISMGIAYLFKPRLQAPDESKLSASNYLEFFAKGFLVNFVNPFVFVLWMAYIGYATSQTDNDFQMSVFLGGILLGILSVELVKVFFANKIKAIFRPDLLVWIFRAIGVGLIGFGIRMLSIVFRVGVPASLGTMGLSF